MLFKVVEIPSKYIYGMKNTSWYYSATKCPPWRPAQFRPPHFISLDPSNLICKINILTIMCKLYICVNQYSQPWSIRRIFTQFVINAFYHTVYHTWVMTISWLIKWFEIPLKYHNGQNLIIECLFSWTWDNFRRISRECYTFKFEGHLMLFGNDHVIRRHKKNKRSLTSSLFMDNYLPRLFPVGCYYLV